MKIELDKIYCADAYQAIKNIPDKSIDLIVTDPPYEIHAGGRGGAFGVEKRPYHLAVSKSEMLNCGVTNDMLSEMCRVMKKVNVYLWCNKTQLSQYLTFFEERGCLTDVLVWCKTNPTPMCNNKYLSDLEYCVFAKEPKVRINGTYETKHKYYVLPSNMADKKLFGHPTIKPLKIIENLIINSSDREGVILDPFMGSGTTALAAKKLERHYIGFEIDPKWTNVAQNRLAGIMADGQFSMFEI